MKDFENRQRKIIEKISTMIFLSVKVLLVLKMSKLKELKFILSSLFFIQIKFLSVNNVIGHCRMINKNALFVADFNFRNVHGFSFSDKTCCRGYNTVFFAS